jgi:hypothetical protein
MYFTTKNGEQQIKDILLPINAAHRHGFIGIFILVCTQIIKRVPINKAFLCFL